MNFKKNLKKVIRVWRIIAGFFFFIILLPTFLAANNSEHFFIITLSLTAIIGGLAFIIKQPLNKKIRTYMNSGLLYLLVGASFITIEAVLASSLPGVLNVIFLTLAALSYAYGLHRLGLSYFLFMI